MFSDHVQRGNEGFLKPSNMAVFVVVVSQIVSYLAVINSSRGCAR